MLMNDFSIIVRKMRVYTERQMSEYNLGFPELIVIMLLSGQGALNQDQIAHSFDLDTGAVSKTLAKLEDKNLIKREINPKNKREKLVSLDASAEPLLKKMHEDLDIWNTEVFAGITDEARDSLIDTVRIMAENSSRIVNEKL